MVKTNPAVSLIIPAHNTAEYISECLDSVLAQTFPDFECIVIDDGSTDTTADIVKKYVEKDKRLRLIEQKHAGASAARNRGLKEATGQYITFIDADDFYAKDTLKKLFNKATETGADIVYYNFARFYDSNEDNWKKNHIDLDQSKVYTKQSLSKNIFNIFPIITCNKLIKHEILSKNKIYFDTKYSRNEDVDFSIRATLAAKTYAYVDYLGYFYRINNPDSETATNYRHPTQLLKILINLNQSIKFKHTTLKQSFDNYAIDQIIGSINLQDSHPDVQREVFDFAASKVIPKLGLSGVNRSYLYRPELFDCLLAIKEKNYTEMLLSRIKMLEKRVDELDNIYTKQRVVINNLSSELDMIYNSSSWKVTKPLRAVNRIRKNSRKYQDKRRGGE